MKKRPNPWNPRPRGFPEKQEGGELYRRNQWTVMSRNFRANNPKCAVMSCKELVSTLNGSRRTGVTDHIIPISEGGAELDKQNFQSLCDRHHNKKSRLEQMYTCLYEWELNEKGRKVPRRDMNGSIIPIAGRGGEYIFQ